MPWAWLPGLHRGRQGVRPSDEITVRYDWGTGRLGLSLGRKARNIGDFALEAETRAREEAEELRVLYVAFTRPRERLYLSYCRERSRGGHMETRHPSRWLYALPPDLLAPAA